MTRVKAGSLLGIGPNGTWQTTRRTVLPFKTGQAYKLTGYRFSHGVDATATDDMDTVMASFLRAAPISTNIVDAFFSAVQIDASADHPSTIGLLQSQWSRRAGAGVTEGQWADQGPWVPYANGLVVPGVYVETKNRGTIAQGHFTRLTYELHYDNVRMSAQALAALALSYGWDADAATAGFEELSNTMLIFTG